MTWQVLVGDYDEGEHEYAPLFKVPRTPQCPESPLLTREKIGDLGLAEVFGGSKPKKA